MDKHQAINLVQETFESQFEKVLFKKFVKNLLNQYDEAEITRTGNFIPDSFKDHVSKYERLGKYRDGEDHRIDILIVYLKRETSIEHARSMQRNFIAGYLQGKYGTDSDKDAALVAFVSPNSEDWRFSLVKLDVQLEATAKGGMKPIDVLTPARRWSFLVGRHEKSHTAQKQIVPIIEDDQNNPSLANLEEAFNIEKVTKEFFEKYRGLFIWTKDELDKEVEKNPKTKADFEAKGIDTVNLAKKLLGQIVFLYFLQKKGWFGVPRDAEWGEGSRNFLRELFEKKHGSYESFYNDVLEHLFYDALRNDRSYNDYYYSRFNCKIPFLNGGLFDPMNNYNWVHTDILLPNSLFSNKNKTIEGDTGNGILDIFDRYNFTVKEDEPFEKEVAIDPELLGKAYEKFNAIRPDNYDEYLKALKSGKKGEETKFNKQYGVYYTPREIVHYMCQQSLINYLHTELNHSVVYQNLGDNRFEMFGNAIKAGQLDITVEHRPMAEISKEDIDFLIQYGESLHEHEMTVDTKGKETVTYSYQLPETIRRNAALIDEKLAAIKICDPAVGSGAFPVGMMSEIVKARHALETFTKTEKTVYDFKRECIENSLYGVDIDPGAVEIAKLRLWLSLVVEEDDPQNIKPLPNLDYKIVCGNSLTGFPSNWDSPIAMEIGTLIHQHFNETSPTKKEELKKQIDEKIASRYENSIRVFGYQVNFDFKIVFSEVFHENKGFDVFIGNPPYIKEYTHREAFNGVRHSPYYQGKMDIWYLFACISIDLLKRNDGILSFIATNNWNTNTGASKFRNKVVKDVKILTWLDFGEYKIFENADIQTMILICSRNNHDSRYQFDLRKIVGDSATFKDVLYLLGKSSNPNNLYLNPTFKRPSLADKPLVFSEDKNESVLNKIVAHGNFKFDKNREIAQGIVAPQDFVNAASREVLGNQFHVGDGIFIISEKEKRALSLSKAELELIKPYYTSVQLRRYYGNPKNDYWIVYTGSAFKNKNRISPYPNIKNHLDKFRDVITSDNRPYGLHRSRAERFFKGEKILSIRKGIEPTFTYTNFDCYVSQSFYIIKTERLDQKYLVGLLNSSLIKFWLRYKGKMQGYLFQIDKEPLLSIPLSNSNLEIQTTIAKLVDRILAAKHDDPQTDTSKWEDEIDQFVYQLYELTEDEIKIVEGRM